MSFFIQKKIMSKENILKKLFAAQKNVNFDLKEPDFSENVYFETTTFLPLLFKEELEKVFGQVFLCETFEDLKQNLQQFFLEKQYASLFCNDSVLQNILRLISVEYIENTNIFPEIDAALTRAEVFVAQTGSLLVSAALPQGRQTNVITPVHLVVGTYSQIVESLPEAFLFVQNKYANNLPSMINIITGASRTADIEKTLVLGAHGPKEISVFLVNENIFS